VTGQRKDEYVLVPRNPTPEMIQKAYWSALGEDAKGVWADMIEAWEGSPKVMETQTKEEDGCHHASETQESGS
jgi:hypothetical protein